MTEWTPEQLERMRRTPQVSPQIQKFIAEAICVHNALGTGGWDIALQIDAKLRVTS